MQQTSFLGLIRVSGADAETFLQGQLTQDVRKALSGPQPAGYCSPKGRLLAVMQLCRHTDGFDLKMHAGVLPAVLKRLRMFVLRSKVALDELPGAAALDELAWRRQNILAGVPVVYPATSDEFVPQMVNLDQLGGISFSKGCYTGQEIVARLHYLGQLKRRMFLLRGEGPPPPAGTPVHAGGESQAAGMVVDGVGEGAGCLLSVVLQLASADSRELRLGGSAAGQALSAPVPYSYPASG